MTAAVGTLCLSGYLTCQINVFLLLSSVLPSFPFFPMMKSTITIRASRRTPEWWNEAAAVVVAHKTPCPWLVFAFSAEYERRKKKRVKWRSGWGPASTTQRTTGKYYKRGTIPWGKKKTTNRGDKTRACERGEKLLIFICLFMIMIIFIKSFSIFVIKCKDVIFFGKGWESDTRIFICKREEFSFQHLVCIVEITEQFDVFCSLMDKRCQKF